MHGWPFGAWRRERKGRLGQEVRDGGNQPRGIPEDVGRPRGGPEPSLSSSARGSGEGIVRNILFIVNDPPYGTERAYNALRLALNLRKKDREADVRVFLVGDGASCAKAGQTVPQGYYNVETMLKSLVKRGATVGVCGTCMDARGLRDSGRVEGTRRSSLDEMTEWTLWADKVLGL